MKFLAVLVARLVCRICKKMGRQGVTWAGQIAILMCPRILSDMASEVRGAIFVTCGTNGKTTTNNMLCSALESEGKKVICNKTGSNMLNGVVAAFVLSANWRGHIDADYACIEIDEASTRQVFPHFKPDFMVLTNLFRDQLDRYGEIDITMYILDWVIKTAENMTIIYNADDALSAYLVGQNKNKSISYGISDRFFDNDDSHEIREGQFCKACGTKLNYEFYHYGQLGSYSCPKCHFKRPDIDCNAFAISLDDGLSFNTMSTRLHTKYKGFYNIYNILAAYCATSCVIENVIHFQAMLDNYNPENGRMESFKIKETEIVLNLAKNPVGFNQNISAVMQDEREKDLIVVINDNDQDGIDISWLWDVDFDRFRDDSINTVIASGIRGLDMRLRFKYENIESEYISNVKEAIVKCIENGSKNLYVLVNYTALFSTRNILKSLEEGYNG